MYWMYEGLMWCWCFLSRSWAFQCHMYHILAFLSAVNQEQSTGALGVRATAAEEPDRDAAPASVSFLLRRQGNLKSPVRGDVLGESPALGRRSTKCQEEAFEALLYCLTSSNATRGLMKRVCRTHMSSLVALVLIKAEWILGGLLLQEAWLTALCWHLLLGKKVYVTV